MSFYIHAHRDHRIYCLQIKTPKGKGNNVYNYILHLAFVGGKKNPSSFEFLFVQNGVKKVPAARCISAETFYLKECKNLLGVSSIFLLQLFLGLKIIKKKFKNTREKKFQRHHYGFYDYDHLLPTKPVFYFPLAFFLHKMEGGSRQSFPQ